MVDAPRITVNDLKKRMDGEDFTLIDFRNPQAWPESDTVFAIRLPPEKLEENLSRTNFRVRVTKTFGPFKCGFHVWQNAGFPVATKLEAA
jgi:hypothetical protein